MCFFHLFLAWFQFSYVYRVNLESFRVFHGVLRVLSFLGILESKGEEEEEGSEALPGSRRVKRRFLGVWSS